MNQKRLFAEFDGQVFGGNGVVPDAEESTKFERLHAVQTEMADVDKQLNLIIEPNKLKKNSLIRPQGYWVKYFGSLHEIIATRLSFYRQMCLNG